MELLAPGTPRIGVGDANLRPRLKGTRRQRCTPRLLGDGAAVAEVEIVQLWSCSEILKGDSAQNPRVRVEDAAAGLSNGSGRRRDRAVMKLFSNFEGR